MSHNSSTCALLNLLFTWWIRWTIKRADDQMLRWKASKKTARNPDTFSLALSKQESGRLHQPPHQLQVASPVVVTVWILVTPSQVQRGFLAAFAFSLRGTCVSCRNWSPYQPAIACHSQSSSTGRTFPESATAWFYLLKWQKWQLDTDAVECTFLQSSVYSVCWL